MDELWYFLAIHSELKKQNPQQKTSLKQTIVCHLINYKDPSAPWSY